MPSKEKINLSKRLDLLRVIAEHNAALKKENHLLLARKEDLTQQISKKTDALAHHQKQVSSTRATMLLENANKNLRNQLKSLSNKKKI